MPTHTEQRLLPYTPEQLYALVADIERYPAFLPWCIAARIRERRTDFISADLVIGSPGGSATSQRSSVSRSKVVAFARWPSA